MNVAESLPQSPAGARKLFYRIQEVSQMTGLKPYVLRYWESEFKELTPAKDASDQRRYRQADIDVILAIRKLLYEDRFTIKGARSRLKEELRRMRSAEAPSAVAVPTVTVTATEAVPVSSPERPAAPSAQVVALKPVYPVAAEPDEDRVDHALHRLRLEVNDLLDMLSH